MTYQQFEQTIKKKTGFEKSWYYGLCIVVIILSEVLFCLIVARSKKFNYGHIFLYSVSFFLLLLGVCGLYKLPNRYNIITVYTSLPLAKKKAAIETLLAQMNVQKTLSDNHCSFVYRKGFWSSPFDIYLFYDDNCICFSVQGQDYSDGGFIDFGGTEKLRKVIAENIQAFLV